MTFTDTAFSPMNAGSGRVPSEDLDRQAKRVFSLAARSELVDAEEDTIVSLTAVPNLSVLLAAHQRLLHVMKQARNLTRHAGEKRYCCKI